MFPWIVRITVAVVLGLIILSGVMEWRREVYVAQMRNCLQVRSDSQLMQENALPSVACIEVGGYDLTAVGLNVRDFLSKNREYAIRYIVGYGMDESVSDMRELLCFSCEIRLLPRSVVAHSHNHARVNPYSRVAVRLERSR